MRAYEVMVILDPDLEERTVAPSLDTSPACGLRFRSGGHCLLTLRVALPRWVSDTAQPSCHGNAVAAKSEGGGERYACL